MNNYYLDLFNLFESSWNSSVRVLQKDINFIFVKPKTELLSLNGKQTFSYINCCEFIFKNDSYYNKEITNKEFFMEFEEMCKKVIDKDFILFRDGYPSDNLLESFFDESHGSGVECLFYLFYQLKLVPYIKHIVIDNIDGVLHFISMKQLCYYFKNLSDYKIIFVMNQDTLFDSATMDIEDLYIIKDFEVYPIMKCTYRKLRPAHNLRQMLRNGEFDD